MKVTKKKIDYRIQMLNAEISKITHSCEYFFHRNIYDLTFWRYT